MIGSKKCKGPVYNSRYRFCQTLQHLEEDISHLLLECRRELKCNSELGSNDFQGN